MNDLASVINSELAKELRTVEFAPKRSYGKPERQTDVFMKEVDLQDWRKQVEERKPVHFDRTPKVFVDDENPAYTICTAHRNCFSYISCYRYTRINNGLPVNRSDLSGGKQTSGIHCPHYISDWAKDCEEKIMAAGNIKLKVIQQ